MKNLLLVVLLFVCSGFAQTFEVDGIAYNVLSTTDKTVEVTSKNPKYTDSVIIPETVIYNTITYSVTTLGIYAFNDCSHLTSVTIPNSVTSIGEYAFLFSANLVSIEVGTSNPNYSSLNGVLYNKAQTELL
jgi:hypothetical protein